MEANDVRLRSQAVARELDLDQARLLGEGHREASREAVGERGDDGRGIEAGGVRRPPDDHAPAFVRRDRRRRLREQARPPVKGQRRRRRGGRPEETTLRGWNRGEGDGGDGLSVAAREEAGGVPAAGRSRARASGRPRTRARPPERAGSESRRPRRSRTRPGRRPRARRGDRPGTSRRRPRRALLGEGRSTGPGPAARRGDGPTGRRRSLRARSPQAPTRRAKPYDRPCPRGIVRQIRKDQGVAASMGTVREKRRTGRTVSRTRSNRRSNGVDWIDRDGETVAWRFSAPKTIFRRPKAPWIRSDVTERVPVPQPSPQGQEPAPLVRKGAGARGPARSRDEDEIRPEPVRRLDRTVEAEARLPEAGLEPHVGESKPLRFAHASRNLDPPPEKTPPRSERRS